MIAIWAVRWWYYVTPNYYHNNNNDDVNNHEEGALVPYNSDRQLLVVDDEGGEGGGQLVRYNPNNLSTTVVRMLQFVNPVPSTKTGKNEEQIQLINNTTKASYS